MAQSKTYSAQIQALAEIMQSINLTGLEKDHRGIHPISKHTRLITVASSQSEVTMTIFNGDPVKGFTFIKGLQASIWHSYNYHDFSINVDDAVARISRLLGQTIDLIDLYDILDYLGCNLPNRDEWETLVYDH